VTASEPVDGNRRSRRFGRFDRIFTVASGLVVGFLAYAASFTVVGRALLALSAAFLFGLAGAMRFRPSMLQGRRGTVAFAGGIALVVAAASVVAVSIPSDRPDMPRIKRTDAHEGRSWATSSCTSYLRSVITRTLQPRDASHRERDEASKKAAALRAKAASDAERAASFDKQWQSLYLAAWRINARWHGNAAVSDKEYHAAVKAMGALCQPLTPGGN